MHSLHTEIEIDAPPEQVWQVLVDFDAYPEWNPFIVRVGGKAEVGTKLENRLQPPGGKAMTFKPMVTEVGEERALEWLGRLVLPGVFDGRHRFELHGSNGGTLFVQSEDFRGVLVPLLKRSLDQRTKSGFEAMNEALKQRAEARSGPAASTQSE